MSPLLQWWQAEIHSSQCVQQPSKLHYTNITPQWKMHLCKMLLLEHEMASFTIRVFGNDAEQQCFIDLTVARNKTTTFSPISNPYHHQHGSFCLSMQLQTLWLLTPYAYRTNIKKTKKKKSSSPWNQWAPHITCELFLQHNHFSADAQFQIRKYGPNMLH
jgi:hypothetical protein